ncbi:MAG: RsmE family RNA methyltransferase [Sedimentisphaerales bacterium]|nr:RsmE family RNA methyltransferase [Sedimentisphaerales bacterium]
MRIYCPHIEQGITIVAGDEAHHLAKVLRCRVGDTVDLFDGKGITAVGVISKIGKDKVEISVSSLETHTPGETGRIIICASVAKGERNDWLVGKCTELGVDRICPVLFERTVKQASGHSVERYNKLALSAAKQCGRLFLPQIDAPAKLIDCLSRLSREYPNARMLFGSTSEKAPTIFEQIQDVRDYIAFIGPEGGLTSDEEQVLRDHGAVGVGLTKTILRIETAAIACASILCVKLR